jgi:hypothetical protein
LSVPFFYPLKIYPPVAELARRSFNEGFQLARYTCTDFALSNCVEHLSERSSFPTPLCLLPPAKGGFDYTLVPVSVKRKNEVFYRFLAATTAPRTKSKSVAGSGTSLEYDDGVSFNKFIEHD